MRIVKIYQGTVLLQHFPLSQVMCIYLNKVCSNTHSRHEISMLVTQRISCLLYRSRDSDKTPTPKPQYKNALPNHKSQWHFIHWRFVRGIMTGYLPYMVQMMFGSAFGIVSSYAMSADSWWIMLSRLLSAASVWLSASEDLIPSCDRQTWDTQCRLKKNIVVILDSISSGYQCINSSLGCGAHTCITYMYM